VAFPNRVSILEDMAKYSIMAGPNHEGMGFQLDLQGRKLPAYQLPILMGGSGKLLVPTDTQLSAHKDEQKFQMTHRHDILLCHLIYGPTTSLTTTHPRDWRVFGDAHRQPAEVPVDDVWR
jgi:hypothetical protein